MAGQVAAAWQVRYSYGMAGQVAAAWQVRYSYGMAGPGIDAAFSLGSCGMAGLVAAAWQVRSVYYEEKYKETCKGARALGGGG
jgi:hypothetical protein